MVIYGRFRKAIYRRLRVRTDQICEKEKVELEEAKANRVFNKNKNGDKTKKKERKALKAKKKLILNSIENPVPSTSSANNEGTNCPGCEHTYDEDWIQYGL
ncbi:hypothetical protein AVEN_146885-1 [Araneus ventricosus]|uniref:Uncharacterized protein n=1 Tax=Araneus ventricosus TaxID=182803 RepID=A0A4Y2LJ03_ARAVE|nr:hypothetical protein AVEN_194368-1 [Araneus ventricosus]GBN14558.1 hypothetical protein AVEN_59384-1 [Araneus ventricosus]GBN14572.1 hypothetical protein AVEN_92046-1 [Araneus ventricosus]GBN14577.1 hypothetical protein AVEN_146885-1 [Araneus ventricosus]